MLWFFLYFFPKKFPDFIGAISFFLTLNVITDLV